jgi:hypothetical protein
MFKKRYFTLGEVVENTRNTQDRTYRHANNVGSQHIPPSPAPGIHVALMQQNSKDGMAIGHQTILAWPFRQAGRIR